jgi:hypothetical protein|tara:strand:+ start:5245 stop:5679 length:435 start_codon:yes stop_codon:yes gene_type:complete
MRSASPPPVGISERARERTNERTRDARLSSMGARRGGGRDGAFTVSKAASDSASSRATFSTARDAQSVTLDDVPEFVEERARAKSEERARRIGNLLLAASLLFGVVRRAVDSWRARRAEAKAKAKRPSDDDEEEKENETKEEEA